MASANPRWNKLRLKIYATLQRFNSQIYLAALFWSSKSGGKDNGRWLARRASADLSIFPALQAGSLETIFA
jgi:hypothetical protein